MVIKNNLTTIITWLVASVTGVMVIVIPLVFFLHSYRNMMSILETEAGINADALTKMVSANPDYWEFEDIRLKEYLQNRPREGSLEIRRIVNKKNKIVSESADNLQSPLMMQSAEIMDSGLVVGRIEISRSLRPLLVRTGILLLVVLLAGAGIFFVLRILPIRSLILAETALFKTNKSLEKTNDLLHKKIIECQRFEMELCKLNEELEQRVAERTLQLTLEIDERQLAEAALRESEKKYRYLTDKMYDVAWITDMNLRTVYVSPSIETALGFTPEERMAQDISEQITPETLNRIREILVKEQELEIQGESDPERTLTYEVEYYHKDGSIRCCENIASGVRDDEGVVIGFHGVSRDITERKKAEKALLESERKYRELVDFLPVAIYEMDMQGNVISGNPAIFKLFGYVQSDLEEGLNALRSMISPDDYNRAVETGLRVLNGEQTGGTEYTGIKKDGSIFPFLNVAGPIIHENKPVGLRGAIIDLTRQKQAEEDLQNAQDMLLQSEKLAAIGRLSAGVAHEILNPVNIISMELQLLQTMKNLPTDMQDELKVCMQQIDRIVTITENLKTFSRIPSKKVVLTSINEIIENIIVLYATQLKIESVELDVQYQSELAEIVADKEKIEQVVLNLIANAVDAMKGKKKKILRIITEQESAPEERQLKITIADTGNGIKSEVMPKIFEPFFTTKEPGKGTGLGLSIAYGIIHDHGGRIWAENNEWGGASFYITLPARTTMKGKINGEDSCC